MGFGLYASFQPPVDTSELQGDGVAVLDELETLDGIALQCRVQPLSSFTDQREVPDDFDGDPEELDDVVGPRADWYPINSGLEALSALASHVRSGSAPSLVESAAVLEDLESLEACLRSASAVQPKCLFRLEAG